MSCLVCAHVLHRVDIDEFEIVTGYERIDPLQGGLEVPGFVEGLLGKSTIDRRCVRACLPIEEQTT
jgi:hypothetical protein